MTFPFQFIWYPGVLYISFFSLFLFLSFFWINKIQDEFWNLIFVFGNKKYKKFCTMTVSRSYHSDCFRLIIIGAFIPIVSSSHEIPGLYSLNDQTSYRQISRSLEAPRLDVIMIVSLWNLTCTSAALLPMCLSNFRAIGKVQTQISWLRDFTRSCGKTSYRLVNKDIECWFDSFLHLSCKHSGQTPKLIAFCRYQIWWLWYVKLVYFISVVLTP